MITATRTHEIAAGHRVVGHEGKCRNLHGHGYVFHLTVCGSLDTVGRVLDFGVIKGTLCQWLEENWDHRMLLWNEDPLVNENEINIKMLDSTVVVVPFNPTAENIAKYLVTVVGPQVLSGYNVTLTRVDVEETRKCTASYELTI